MTDGNNQSSETGEIRGRDSAPNDPSSASNPARMLLVAIGVIVLVATAVFWGRKPAEPEKPIVVVPPSVPQSGSAPRIPFTDITESAGIAFTQYNGAAGQKLLPETMGSGAAFFDYDQDGDPDLVMVSGCAWPWDESSDPEERSSLALYRNDDGQFTDVTSEFGLKLALYAMGVAVGDYDSDGDDDLYVTGVGENRLFQNEQSRFVDVTQQKGLEVSPDTWGTSAGFFDYDRDGDLDLFVCNYVAWSKEIDLAADYRLVGIGRSYGPPFNFRGSQPLLYRNDSGTFVDVSQAAGIHVTNESTGVPVGKGLAVTFQDVDADGWLDILVANDTVRNFLFRNTGEGKFEEVGQYYGFAYDANGGATGAMGIDTGWFRNNSDLGVLIGNFANEMSSFYVSQEGNLLFTDEAISAGIGGPTRKALTFGVLIEDFDLDGRQDMVQANGHLEDKINQVQPSQSYKQSAQLFWNAGEDGEHEFEEIGQEGIGDLATPVVGRGLASADIDADGDLDLVLTQINGSPLLLRNDQDLENNWLRCRLEYQDGNPHGIGAIVEITCGTAKMKRLIMPTRSYLSQSEPIATFGLGKIEQIDSLQVTWPDGSVQSVEKPAVNQLLVVKNSGESFAELANKAKAQLENGRFTEALEPLNKALAIAPDSAPIRRNIARAYLLGGDPTSALEELEPLGAEGTSAATEYVRGIAHMRLSQYSEAERHLASTATLAPREATVRFQWATALSAQGKSEQAKRQYEETIQLDPLHGGAHYQLATLARKQGDPQAFEKLMRDFERIKLRKGTTTTDATQLENCVFSQAEDAVPNERLVRSQAAEPNFQLRSRDGNSDGSLPSLQAVAAYALNSDDTYRLVAIDQNGELVVFDAARDGGWKEIARSGEVVVSSPVNTRLIVGNAIVDAVSQEAESVDSREIAIANPEELKLFRFSEENGFTELTAPAGLSEARGSDFRWVDLEHDGDLDLCLSDASGLKAWRNNGDGTFREATNDFSLAVDTANPRIAAVDLDDDNTAVDLIGVSAEGSFLLRNQFGGEFLLDETASKSWQGSEQVVANDFDNDGNADVLLVSSNSLRMYKPVGEPVQRIALEFDSIEAVEPIDYDNDGWLDLVIAGHAGEESRCILFANVGGEFAISPTTLPGTSQVIRDGLLALDIDSDGDSDLLRLAKDGPAEVLLNQTETKNKQVKLALHSYVGQPSSIGVRVQVRRKEFLACRWTDRELPLEIGVAENSTLDSIQTLWGNGVVDNQIELAVTEHPIQILIFELVRTGSCPFFYALVDGQWQFQCDLLGAAPLNVAVARDVALDPDPLEQVVLGPLRNFLQGELATVRITSEMREAIYLDQIKLRAVEHPEGTTLFSSDRLQPTVAADSSFYLGSNPRTLRTAHGSDGIDRTIALQSLDDRFCQPGTQRPPSIGVRAPWSIELDFGELPPSQDLLLALTGWLRFGSSSNNIALSQRSDLALEWPKLEVQTSDGQWHRVETEVGLPAGQTKTIAVDLTGKLPPTSRKFRLSTSFEVSWDQIALYDKVPSEQLVVRELALEDAELAWYGFSEMKTVEASGPQIPDSSKVSQFPAWFDCVQGWCTRYGPVTELVGEADEKLAIINSGDGITLSFSAEAISDPKAGMQQTLVVLTKGWIKEGDPNSIRGMEIEPYPGSDRKLEGDEDWQLQYNTRWVPKHRFENPLNP